MTSDAADQPFSKRDEFLILARSALEVMAASEIALSAEDEDKAGVLQRHLISLSTVIEIANNKLRSEDSSLDAALDVIDNLFDLRYGGRDAGERKEWLASFRTGRRPRERAAWAGLTRRPETAAMVRSSTYEIEVEGEWVPGYPNQFGAPAQLIRASPVPSRQERYDAARKVAGEARRRSVHERPEVRTLLMALRRAEVMRMQDIAQLLPFEGRTAAVRVMNWLREDGWVEKRGKGAGIRWVATDKLRKHKFDGR